MEKQEKRKKNFFGGEWIFDREFLKKPSPEKKSFSSTLPNTSPPMINVKTQWTRPYFVQLEKSDDIVSPNEGSYRGNERAT